MASVLDIINGALLDIGAIAIGDTPSADEATHALQEANRMLGTWSNESLIPHDRAHEKFTLTGGKGSYTIGVSGSPDFNTTRPQEIEVATIEYENSSPLIEFPPLKILTREQWAGLSTKAIQSDVPTMIFYEPNYPNGTLYLYPVPSVANKLVITSRKPLTNFTGTAQVVSLPPGWDDAIQKNLALRLAPAYRRDPSQFLLMQAGDAKANIEAANSILNARLMTPDAGTVRTGRFNIYTGGR